MPPIDLDGGMSGDVDRLSALLSQPAVDPAVPEKKDTVVVAEPKPVRTAQRNTVQPTQAQDAPPDDQGTSGEDEGDDSAPPTIEAPASWDAEAKLKWAKLPDDLKALVTARENDRENATKQRLNEAAEIRKRAEEAETVTATARSAYEQRLGLLAKQLEATIPAEFQSLRSQADLAALAAKDPAAYTRFMAWRDMASGIVREMEQAKATREAADTEKQNALVTREAKALVEKWPELLDPVKSVAIKAEISTTLKDFGFTDQEIGGIADHRILLFARKYMEGQKALTALETAKGKLEAKKLPKVLKPSAGEGAGSQTAMTQAQRHKVAKSGDQGLTVAALERMLSTPQ